VRRLVLIAIAVAALTSCGHTRRPEGLVERWLQSLDQGEAGNPEKYAPDETSTQILPGFRSLDPGELDTIEVGKATDAVPRLIPVFTEYLVPFRVVDQDGNERRGSAVVAPDLEPPIVSIRDEPGPPLPSEGGPPIAQAPGAWWLAGLAMAIGLTLVAILLMSFVRGPRRSASPMR
jgi:hypothetical protein